MSSFEWTLAFINYFTGMAVGIGLGIAIFAAWAKSKLDN